MDNKLKTLMDENFLGYASYVIKERAIPHIDDGLKPVQRRILHTLFEVDDGKYHKVANVVGHTMRYHPHGDASIEDALINIAQKNYFIDQQGNFGNIITGDPASAARYIECRLSPLAQETLFNKEITEYVDSYDGRNKEPVVLPSKLPSLLMSGVEGIAVGLSTKILPHNFNELLEAQIKILKGQDFEIYPDFQQGGTIDISDYQKGKGKVKVRAKVEITDNKTMVIKEIPFGTTTESLIASIENAISKGKLKISQINDFTAESVEIELKMGHGVNAQDVYERLFLYTDCELSVSSNVVVIKDKNPIETDVNEILIHNTNKLVNILESELKFNLEKLKNKLHEKKLTKIFIQNKLYLNIEKAETYEELEIILKEALEPFEKDLEKEVSYDDIEKLLSIPVKRISKFDMDKTLLEIREIESDIKDTEENLSTINYYTIKYLKDLVRKYGKEYPRKTQIDTFESIDITKVAVQDVKVGYDPKTNYFGTEVKDPEPLLCSSFDKILLFLDNGEYKVINIPDKLFIEGNLLAYNKQSSLKQTTVVYLDESAGIYYMKRFVINKFILDKVYRFVPENAKIIYFSQEENPIIEVEYTPLKRSRITKEYFHLGRLLVKSVSSIGNHLATRPIAKLFNAKQDIIDMFESQPEEIVKLRPPSEDDEQPTLFEGVESKD
ncbi:MAG: DNA topoisomerase IV subunit A [Candidatus Sericytochromatia bacterium]